jgi:hypothetical protein
MERYQEELENERAKIQENEREIAAADPNSEDFPEAMSHDRMFLLQDYVSVYEEVIANL